MVKYSKQEGQKLIMLNLALMWLVSLVCAVTLGPILLPYPEVMVVTLIALVAVYFIVVFFSTNKILNYIIVYALTGVFGATLFSTIGFYVGELGTSLVVGIIVTCVAVFTICAVIGFKSSYKFDSLGKILFIALLVLIGFSLASLFFNFGHIILALGAGVGVAIFVGYTLYDFYILREFEFEDYLIPIMAFNLFLDLFNLILQALKLVYHLVNIFKD